MVDLTGRKDAIAIRDRYQRRADEVHHTIREKVEWLYKMNHKLKYAMADASRLTKDIRADEEERKKLYSSLQNLLKQETNFEERMWSKTQKGNKLKSITIHQKYKDSDVEAKYDSMLNYLKQYPQYTSKSSFSRILDKISDIERGIKETTKAHHEAVSRAQRELAYFPRNIMEAKNIVKAYLQIMTEGDRKLSEMRYNKGVFFKMTSERRKLEVTMDRLHHKVDEFVETINKFEEEVEAAKKELETQHSRTGR